MHNIVEALQEIIAKGAELVDGDDSPSLRLQDWLSERGEVFAQLNLDRIELGAEEQQAVSSLIGKILGLDVKVLSRLESQLKDLGEEIAATRRLRKLLRNHSPARGRFFFHRAV